MNKGFETEAVARESAKKDMPSKHVTIIESQGQFYVEPTDAVMMLRSWERECYAGLGKGAVPKGGYWTCQRCTTFNAHGSTTKCKRCGQDCAIAPAGVPL